MSDCISTRKLELTEVGRCLAQEDLADELAGGVPDLHAIAAAGVDVASAVTVYAWDQRLPDNDCRNVPSGTPGET